MTPDSKNLFTQEPRVTQPQREQLLGQRAHVVWLTGLSGSGKSTLAIALEHELHSRGFATYMLDGDNLRQGLNRDLGFEDGDRAENIRRVGEVAALMKDAGLIVITAFISPFAADREMARKAVGPDRFIEVYVQCPLEVCEQRDVKGLYKKARDGSVPQFTGIHSGYEEPKNPDIIISTGEMNVQQSVELLLNYVLSKLNAR